MNSDAPDTLGPADAYRAGWASAATWGSADRMNDLETLLWRSERHPEQSSTIVMLMTLDRTPSWKRLRAAHEWGSAVVPLMRKRVVEPALPLGPPTWAPDPDFDLDHHLRRVTLPAPGGQDALLELAQEAALAPFDRARPLWEATLIEGLADGSAAYLLKLHHSLTDGRGVAQLLSLIQSPVRRHTPKDDVVVPPPARSPGPVGLTLGALEERVRRSPRAAARLVAAQASAATHPRRTLSSSLRYAGSARKLLTPSAPGSPLLSDRAGTDWRFAVMECPFPELRAAAKAASGSVNDAYVAALLGGLRRYHEKHGQLVDEIPMAMPVSVRRADDPMGGNKFAGVMFAAPLAIEDPAERIATVRGTVLSLRVEPAMDSVSLIAPLLNASPSGWGAALLRAGATADLSATNVPGIPRPSYLAGARIERCYGFGPLPGVAVMASLTTYSGTACFGLNCDGRAVPDVPLLMECMRAGLDEVLALGRS